MNKKPALSRTIIIKFSLTRNRALAAMVGVLLCIMAVDLGCETLTLTTYYPAPYGVYSKMRITEYLQSGPTGRTIRIGDIEGLPWAGGAGGILPNGTSGIYADPGSDKNLTFGASGDAELKPDKDLVLHPGGDLVLGPGIYFKDMCRWVPYTTGAGVRTRCDTGNPGKWSVFTSANASNQSSTAFVKDAGWDDAIPATQITHAVFVMSTSGSMLCCKLEQY